MGKNVKRSGPLASCSSVENASYHYRSKDLLRLRTRGFLRKEDLLQLLDQDVECPLAVELLCRQCLLHLPDWQDQCEEWEDPDQLQCNHKDVEQCKLLLCHMEEDHHQEWAVCHHREWVGCLQVCEDLHQEWVECLQA